MLIALKEYESLSPTTNAVLNPYKLDAERFLMKTREMGLDGRAFLESMSGAENSVALLKRFSLKQYACYKKVKK